MGVMTVVEDRLSRSDSADPKDTEDQQKSNGIVQSTQHNSTDLEARCANAKGGGRESQDEHGLRAVAFLIGFVKSLRYTATKVFYSRQYTPYHLYIDYTC